jgi:hypothetical protein
MVLHTLLSLDNCFVDINRNSVVGTRSYHKRLSVVRRQMVLRCERLILLRMNIVNENT